MGRLPEKLKRNEVSFGAWVTIVNPEVPEMLSLLGFDWLLFDLEHAPIDFQHLETMLMGVRGDVTPLVRVPFNDPVYVKRVLDLGVAGVLFPLINNRQDALLAVRAVRYPPDGIRGVGPRRAASYGLRTSEYFEEAKNVLVIVQIETKEAVENAGEILSVEGVSAFFVGPNDLSFSYGKRDWREKPVREAIERLAEVAEETGIPGGMYCSNNESLSFALQHGFKLIALGSDYRFLVAGARTRLETAHKMLSQ
ncbi:MAG: aldolase/citrate lyase family protein [Infirmifilum sp.]